MMVRADQIRMYEDHHGGNRRTLIAKRWALWGGAAFWLIAFGVLGGAAFASGPVRGPMAGLGLFSLIGVVGCAVFLLRSHMVESERLTKRLEESDADTESIRQTLVEERTRPKSDVDGLTRLPTCTAFDRTLGRLLESGATTDVGVVFLGIDHIRELNESIGYEAGDALLIEVGRRLSECAQSGIWFARHSGDRFIGFAHGPADVVESNLASQVRQVFEAPIQIEGMAWHISASSGIAMVRPNESIHQLCRRAESAMVEAKDRRVFGSEPESELHPQADAAVGVDTHNGSYGLVSLA